MRAIVFGLLGAVLAVGAADARKNPNPDSVKRCSVSERTFTVERAALVPEARLAHPDLIGRAVHVVRTASDGHWDAVEISDGSRAFVVRFDVTPHATPAVMGSSWEGSTGRGVDWSSKHAVGPITSAGIYDGPLAGLSLSEGACD